MEKCFFLLDSLGIGGSERKSIRAANLLVERGYPVHVAFLNAKSDLRDMIDPRIPVYVGNRKGKLDLRLLKEIRRYIQDHGIQVTWAVNLYPILYLFFATRGMGGKVRVIGTSNITVFRNSYEQMKMKLYAPVIRRLDGFVFGSHQQQAQWQREYSLYKVGLHVVHNGIDTSWFSAGALDLDRSSARENYGFSDSDIVIGMVAQFRVEKAHEDLVAACRTLRQSGFPVKLLLVGSGNEEDRIHALAAEWGILDAIVFTGQLDDVRPALTAMDIFALTSRAVETFSNAALEAMSMKLPAVLSDLSGASEMISDEVNGFIYPPGDVGALTEALERFMDKDFRQSCGSRAREVVVERFSSSIMADQYVRVIWGT